MATVHESFAPGAIDPRWVQIAIGRARVERAGRLRLCLDEARAGQLALAQLDDYICRPRAGYLWSPPLVLETRVRHSHAGGELQGTAGFGFWNNPAPLWGTRIEVSPNWAWFYYASPQSTLALTAGPPSGFKAAVVYGGRGGGLAMGVMDALLKVPLVGRALAGTKLPAVEAALPDRMMAEWHTYRIAWQAGEIAFQVDGQTVLHTRHLPAAPLGFVAWVDNNVASVSPQGEMQLGNLAVAQPQWLEMEYLRIEAGGNS